MEAMLSLAPPLAADAEADVDASPPTKAVDPEEAMGANIEDF
jgi:hypothetical protein